MRAQPSISPLTLGICCATIAGALALAPGRGPLPDGPLRGADVMALDAAGGSGDGQTAASGPVRPDEADDAETGATATREATDVVALPDGGRRGDTSCAGDCDEAPTVVPVGATSTKVAGDEVGGDDRAVTDAPPGEATAAAGDADTGGVADTEVSGDGAIEDHSCRSPRADAASPPGQAAAAEPSPCSRGRGHDGCQGSDCTDRRSRGTAEA